MRLVHLTDPHLTSLEGVRLRDLSAKRKLGYLSWRRKRRHKHRPEILERVIDAVRSEQVDQIALTGDLTHLGLDAEIEAAAHWLRSLGPPEQVMLVPGNHDAYTESAVEKMHACWAEYLGTTKDDGFPTIRSVGDVTLIGATSGRPSPIFLATGYAGAPQCSRLGIALAEHTDRLCCLLIHHPPGRDVSPRKALTDPELLNDTLSQHPPALVLHGHVHRNTEHRQGATHVFATASASSAYSDRPASYRVFDIERDEAGWRIEMTLKSLDADAGFRIDASTTWKVKSRS